MSYQLCEKIKNLQPYEPISGEYSVRLDANESFVELPEDTWREVHERIGSSAVNRYPDPLAAEICSLFGEYHGISPEYITAGNGSDELLSVITQAFLMRGERMTVLDREFSMYNFYGSLAEVEVSVFKKREDGTIDSAALIDYVNQNGSRLLMFSNPCNPTGLALPTEEVMSIVDGCPNCLVVVDEAYMDFWDQPVIQLAPQRDNMIVLRTCSKAFRMAGMRVGFAVACRRLTDALRAVKSPYNVNTLSQEAAAAVLSRPDEIHEAVRLVLSQRDALFAALSEMEKRHEGAFSLVQTVTNFMFINMPAGRAKEMFEALKAKGIVIRLLGSSLRVTVGTAEENEQFLAAFESLL
ncbi:MAG: histidinol-phosphate aminotransferase family protein [Ruminococcaceae bacterium]|nr:histidinol-phosphate aminotransferase family protein [Oscillospiraceae bacterium]